MENITHCICPISGTFVVLFVKKSFNVSAAPALKADGQPAHNEIPFDEKLFYDAEP